MSIKTEVDELSALRAQIATLQERADTLVERLKRRGSGTYMGTLLKALVYKSTCTCVNWRALAEELSIPARVIERHTTSKPTLCLKLKSRS